MKWSMHRRKTRNTKHDEEVNSSSPQVQEIQRNQTSIYDAIQSDNKPLYRGFMYVCHHTGYGMLDVDSYLSGRRNGLMKNITSRDDIWIREWKFKIYDSLDELMKHYYSHSIGSFNGSDYVLCLGTDFDTTRARILDGSFHTSIVSAVNFRPLVLYYRDEILSHRGVQQPVDAVENPNFEPPTTTSEAAPPATLR